MGSICWFSLWISFSFLLNCDKVRNKEIPSDFVTIFINKTVFAFLRYTHINNHHCHLINCCNVHCIYFIRSMLSKRVTKAELGKIFSLLASLEAAGF